MMYVIHCVLACRRPSQLGPRWFIYTNKTTRAGRDRLAWSSRYKNCMHGSTIRLGTIRCWYGTCRRRGEPNHVRVLPLSLWSLSNPLVFRKPLQAYVLELLVAANHQNGKDTHVRGLVVYGPKECVSLLWVLQWLTSYICKTTVHGRRPDSFYKPIVQDARIHPLMIARHNLSIGKYTSH